MFSFFSRNFSELNEKIMLTERPRGSFSSEGMELFVKRNRFIKGTFDPPFY